MTRYLGSYQNNKERVQLLANERDLLDIQNEIGDTVLFDAIATGNLETVEILLEAGANVDIINKSLIDEIRLFGFSEIEQQRIKYLVLRSAIKQNNKERVQLLANERDLLDIQNEIGDTVLFDAIATGNLEIVEILLKAGANVDIINKSLIDEIRLFGFSEIEQQRIKYLVLRSAIKQNNKELVQLLANERDLLDIQNEKGETVLVEAIKIGNPETVEILFKAGANMDLINKSLIDEVRSRGLSEIAQQLITAKEEASE